MKAKLYVILGSHACRAGMLIAGAQRHRVPAGGAAHRSASFVLRLRGFAGNPAPFRRLDDRPHRMLGAADRMGTLPALLIDGQRVKTNREIARFLDGIRPDPPLFPTEADRRRAVEEAERWATRSFR
jgi:glutathione S-transferase